MTDAPGPERRSEQGLRAWSWMIIAAAAIIAIALAIFWRGGGTETEIPGAPPQATEEKATPPQTNPAPANTQPPQENAPAK